jgi:hypothetical protein
VTGCANRFLAGCRAPVDQGLEAAFLAREVSVAAGGAALDEPEPCELYVPDRPGRHALVVFLDGEPVASLPLRISG